MRYRLFKKDIPEGGLEHIMSLVPTNKMSRAFIDTRNSESNYIYMETDPRSSKILYNGASRNAVADDSYVTYEEFLTLIPNNQQLFPI